MAKWSMDLSKYADVTTDNIKEIRRHYAFLLYGSIVEKTPVDTGRARGNWTITLDQPTTTTSDRTTPQFTSVKQTPKPEGDEEIFISNNLPYIAKLEYGGFPNPPKKDGGKTVGGYSRQAPEGMVGVTMANNKAIVETAVRSVIKK